MTKSTARIPVRDRAFPQDPTGLLPPVTPDNVPYWNGLAEGRLVIQLCSACGRLRFPIVPVCPYCLYSGVEWRAVSGAATVFSWVRYQRGYLPEFEDVMPYVVVTAALAEGPRMFGRLKDRDVTPEIGQPLSVVIERWPDGRCVPAFSLKDTARRGS